MGKTISIAGNKGGISKTTLSMHLAYYLGQKLKKKVLVIDLDAQCDISEWLLDDYSKVFYNFSNAEEMNKFLQEKTIIALFGNKLHSGMAKNIIYDTKYENIDIVPSAIDISTFTSIVTADSINGLKRIKKFIDIVKQMYDYIVIDCPPDINIFVQNAIVASDYLLFPTQPEMASMRGVAILESIYKGLKSEKLTQCEILGVVSTMTDLRLNLHKIYHKQLEEKYGDVLFKEKMNISTIYKESMAIGETIFQAYPTHKTTFQLKKLLDEIITRMLKEQKHD